MQERGGLKMEKGIVQMLAIIANIWAAALVISGDMVTRAIIIVFLLIYIFLFFKAIRW